MNMPNDIVLAIKNNNSFDKKLDSVELDGVELDGVELDGVELDGAELDGAELDGAELDGAELDGVELDHKDNISILDKIVSSYNSMNIEIKNYNEQIRLLRNDADNLKEDIYLKKNIRSKDKDKDNDLDKKKKLKKKIDINNFSINEETCKTAVDQINSIKSNISTNSKLASEILIPLEASVDLLKAQVKYTVILEDILELFNQKDKLEKKLGESNQIITMLAESLEI